VSDIMTNNAKNGDFSILFAMGIFGSFALFLRTIPNVPTLAFTLALQVVGVVGMAIRARHSVWHLRKHFPLFCLLAISAVANDLCYFISFRTTSVSNAAVAHQSVSIFLLFLTPLVLGDRVQRAEWKAFVVAIIGVLILYSQGLGAHGSKDLEGVTIGVLSGFFYAVVVLSYVVIGRRRIPAMEANIWRYAISIVLFLPVLPAAHLGSISARDFALLAAFGMVFAVIATSFHTFGMTRSRPLHASILGKTEPVFAVVYALLFLGEVPSLTTVIGGGLILGSSVWLTLVGVDEADSLRL
jgi:drug/metabolite transporter (DMT)-like permease